MHTLIVAALKRLDSREFRPPGALAASLEAPPEAVDEALREAIAAGAPVECAPGRGYRLSDPIDWLDAVRIQSAVRHTGLSVCVLDACGSTNRDLMRAARAGAAHGRVLAAELQTEGRGRQGRPWHSGIGAALTFSLLGRFRRGVSDLGGLSLAVGVAIARALRAQGVEAELKWPNDLVWREAKLGGILIEVHGAAAGACAAVIGIGLNVRLRDAQRARIDQAACDLRQAGAPALARSDWLALVLLELSAALARFQRDGFAPFVAEWDRYHAHAGRPVELALAGGERLRGIATGVDASGRLLLATAGGTQAIMTGDVSLRASG